MNREKKVSELADAALNSLEGISRAEPRPFLYTRLNARMQQESANFWERTARYLTRPAVAMVCVLLVLLANGLALINKKTAEPDLPELMAEEYTASEMGNSAAVLFDMDNNTEP
jgi:hypothetical protein